MRRPIQFLMKHRNLVIDAFLGNNRRPQKTWEDLRNLLPELKENMSYNTFKQYVSILTAISSELDAVRQEKNELVSRLDKMDRQKSKLEERIRVLEKEHTQATGRTESKRTVRQESKRIPRRVMGWSVQQSKDGYYRCFRKIEGRVHCIYIGKAMAVKIARLKIRKKEVALGIRKH